MTSDKSGGDVRFVHDQRLGKPEYSLNISDSFVEISSSDSVGAFYGLQSLRQILVQSKNIIWQVSIIDEPDIEVRSVLIDISHDKIPKMETLCKMIDMLC